jgi:DNA-binding CsgD family transcriptional regulator
MAEYGEPLSNREIEVLQLVATGATNRQIAHKLVVSVNTVKVHLRNIFTKLGVESRTEATLIAIREGLVSVPASEEEAGSGPPAYPFELEPGTLDRPTAGIPAQILSPLPWPKRVALIVSLLLVALATVVTWPRSNTAAERSSEDTDNIVNGGGSGSIAGESSGWRALAPMTVARSRFGLAGTPNGRLYAIGGETNGGTTGAVERYDPATDQWTPLSMSKPTRVRNIGAAAIGEWIYVPGGLTPDGEPTASVEALNPTREIWEQVAPLPRPLSSYALAVYEDKVYVFGGKDDRGYVINSSYIYDPQQDEWKEGRAMPTPRAYAGAATLGPRIFVVGGYDGQREYPTCEVYTPELDSWESCEPLTLGRGGVGLAGVANQLYVVGGGWLNYAWFSEKHDPVTGEWSAFETPVGRQWRNLAVASMPDKFYVAGGWNGDYLNGVWEYEVLWHKIHIPVLP